MSTLDKILITPEAVRTSRVWFDNQIQAAAKLRLTPNKVLLDKSFHLTGTLTPGKLYFFFYDAKLKAEAEKNIADFGDNIKVLNGRFGPYITDGKKNAKIDKKTDPATITHEQALALLATAPATTGKRRFVRRKKK